MPFTSFEKALANQMTESAGSATSSSSAKGSDLVSSARGFIGQMVSEVQNRQAIAKQAVQNVMQGEDASLHKAVIAMDEASLSFQLLVEMRNKVVESLQEMMRMQV
jgi:flagellar hook-basal body complex protein FliE